MLIAGDQASYLALTVVSEGTAQDIGSPVSGNMVGWGGEVSPNLFLLDLWPWRPPFYISERGQDPRDCLLGFQLTSITLVKLRPRAVLNSCPPAFLISGFSHARLVKAHYLLVYLL